MHDPSYKLLVGQDENATSAISSFCAALDRLVEKTRACVLYVAHFSKGNQSGKASIDRTSGSGIFGRDADTIITVTEHQVPNCYSMEFISRSFKPVPAFVVEFDYPLMKRREDLDAGDLKAPNGKSSGIISIETILEMIPDGEENPISQKDFFLVCAEEDISEKKAREGIKILLQENRVFTHNRARATGRAEILYHKQPPPA